MLYSKENEGDTARCPYVDASHRHTWRERSWTQETTCVVQFMGSL